MDQVNLKCGKDAPDVTLTTPKGSSKELLQANPNLKEYLTGLSDSWPSGSFSTSAGLEDRTVTKETVDKTVGGPLSDTDEQLTHLKAPLDDIEKGKGPVFPQEHESRNLPQTEPRVGPGFAALEALDRAIETVESEEADVDGGPSGEVSGSKSPSLSGRKVEKETGTEETKKTTVQHQAQLEGGGNQAFYYIAAGGMSYGDALAPKTPEEDEGSEGIDEDSGSSSSSTSTSKGPEVSEKEGVSSSTTRESSDPVDEEEGSESIDEDSGSSSSSTSAPKGPKTSEEKEVSSSSSKSSGTVEDEEESDTEGGSGSSSGTTSRSQKDGEYLSVDVSSSAGETGATDKTLGLTKKQWIIALVSGVALSILALTGGHYHKQIRKALIR